MRPRASPQSALRVVILIDTLGPAGGAEKLARLVAIRLDHERFKRTLCVSRWSPEHAADPTFAAMVDELQASGVRFIGLQRTSRLSLWAWRPLLATLRREADILHAHKFGSNLWAAALGSLARPPVLIAHEHTWSFEGQPWRRFLDREVIARRADAVIAVSREDRRRMIEVEGIDPESVVLIPNGIAPLPAPGGSDVRRALGIEASSPVVGTACTLRPQKALDVLVRAAALLRSELPDLRVLIAGEGEERRRLESLVEALDLEGMVMLLGRRSDVPDLLHSLDVAVCSSDFEGTPLSVMEYMAAGLPVVSTRVGGVPEVIEHGVHGLLVEPRDPEGLAKAVGELLREPERAAEMGRRGQERQRREFDVDLTVRRLADLYEDLYAASPRADPTRVAGARAG